MIFPGATGGVMPLINTELPALPVLPATVEAAETTCATKVSYSFILYH